MAFLWYRRLILAEYHVSYTHYWFPLIEAAVLAKVIMVGDILGLGRGLEHKPLILPTRQPEVLLVDFASSSVTYRVWAWTREFALEEIIRDRIRSAV